MMISFMFLYRCFLVTVAHIVICLSLDSIFLKLAELTVVNFWRYTSSENRGFWFCKVGWLHKWFNNANSHYFLIHAPIR